MAPTRKPPKSKDTLRLDWLQEQSLCQGSDPLGGGNGWVARMSRTGRGFRLHEISERAVQYMELPPERVHTDIREAIDAAMRAQAEGRSL